MDALGWTLAAAALGFLGNRLWQERRLRIAAEKAVLAKERIWKNLVTEGVGGLWDWDLRTGEMTASNTVAELLGMEPPIAPMKAEAWAQLLHPEDQEPCAAAFEALLQGQKDTFEKELRYRRRDGHYAHLLSRARVVERDAAGKPLRVIGTHVNLSPLRCAQRHREESESRFREIFECSLDSIYVLDVLKDGRFRIAAVNPANERQFNMSAAEQVGRYSHEVLPPHVRDEQLGYYRMCVNSGRSLTIDESAKLNGRTRHWITTLMPVRDEKGHVERIIGIAHDTTQVKEAELALRASEQKLREVFEHSSESIIMYEVDAAGEARLISMNPVAGRVLEFSEAELIGKTPRDFFPPETLPVIEEVIARCLRTGKNVSFSRRITVGPREWHFHSSYIPVRNDEGRIYRILFIARNLAEQLPQHELMPLAVNKLAESRG